MKHDRVSGCKTKFLRKEERDSEKQDGIVLIFFCENHKVEICRCGYEWGKHPAKEIQTEYLERFLDKIFKRNENTNLPLQDL